MKRCEAKPSFKSTMSPSPDRIIPPPEVLSVDMDRLFANEADVAEILLDHCQFPRLLIVAVP